MDVLCTICNHHDKTLEQANRHNSTAEHQSRLKVYQDGIAAGEYKASSEIARLQASNALLLASLEELFENCAMIHNVWGEGSNTAAASNAIDAAKQALAHAKEAK